MPTELIQRQKWMAVCDRCGSVSQDEFSDWWQIPSGHGFPTGSPLELFTRDPDPKHSRYGATIPRIYCPDCQRLVVKVLGNADCVVEVPNV